MVQVSENMKSLSIDLDNKSSDNSITEKLSEISQIEINLEIKNDSGGNVNKMKLNVPLFTKIKEIQDLPDWVIIKLLLSNGRLASSNFRDRILND